MIARAARITSCARWWQGRGALHPLWLILLAAASMLAATIWIFTPLTGAYYRADDYGFLAIARHLASPLDPFLVSHFPGGIYWRPLGLAFWWLADRVADSVEAQYVVTLALHGLVASALAWLARFCGATRGVAAFTACAFVIHPVAVGTTVWLANRFDMLAAFFVLTALALGLRASWWSRSAALLLCAAAFLSKESGFAAPVALCAATLVTGGRLYRSRLVWAGLYATVGAAGYLWRLHVLPVSGDHCLSCDAVTGTPDYLAYGLLYAIGGSPSSFLITLALMIVAIGGIALTTIRLSARNTTSAWAPWFAVVIALAAVSAIAAIAVARFSPTARLFYLPLALGLVALATLARIPRRSLNRCILSVFTLLLAGLWLSNSSIITRQWLHTTQNGDEAFTEQLKQALQKRSPPSLEHHSCMVVIKASHAPSGTLAGFIDVAVKAVLPERSRWVDCVFFLPGSAPYYAVLPKSPDHAVAFDDIPQRFPAMQTPSLWLIYPKKWNAKPAHRALHVTVNPPR